MGEFSRHRMLGVDISYWSAGDRGSISTTITKWQWCIARGVQLLFSFNFYRNGLRTLVFHSKFVLLLQWVGPLQHVVFPLLIPFRPELGVNQALLLLIAGK